MNLFKLNRLKKSIHKAYKNSIKMISDIEDMCLTMPCKNCFFRNGKDKDCFISNMKNYAIELQKVCENIEKNT